MSKNMKKVNVKIEITELETGKTYKKEFDDWIDKNTEIQEMLDFFENGV